jgi:hypothetical protein
MAVVERLADLAMVVMSGPRTDLDGVRVPAASAGP